MNKMIKFVLLGAPAFAVVFVPAPALAHCPLCTAGAGLVAVGAYWIGAKAITIGVLLGTFATAMGLWFGRLIKRQYIAEQKTLIAILSWVLTLVPLAPLFSDYVSRYISWSGDYGGIFNRTYALNLFWVGAVIGTIVTILSPVLSRALTRARGRHFEFQGLIVNLVLMTLVALIVQLL